MAKPRSRLQSMNERLLSRTQGTQNTQSLWSSPRESDTGADIPEETVTVIRYVMK